VRAGRRAQLGEALAAAVAIEVVLGEPAIGAVVRAARVAVAPIADRAELAAARGLRGTHGCQRPSLESPVMTKTGPRDVASARGHDRTARSATRCWKQ